MGFISGKIEKNATNGLYEATMEYSYLIFFTQKTMVEFETYELAIAYVAKQRCKGQLELPNYE